MKSILYKAVLPGFIIWASLAFAEPSAPVSGASSDVAATSAAGAQQPAADAPTAGAAADVDDSDGDDDEAEEFVADTEESEEPASEASVADADLLGAKLPAAGADADLLGAQQPTAGAPAAGAQQPAAGAGAGVKRKRPTMLGLMYLESFTGHDRLAEELTGVMVTKLESLGLYEVYRPGDIDKALAAANIRKPGVCRDPLCVKSIAKSLGLRRMIYGSVDMNRQRVAVTLTLVDVSLNRPVERVSIEGAPGVPAKVVLESAIDRLHGYKSGVDATQYYGPSANNMKGLLWSTLATQGVGLFYSIINYGAGDLSPEDGIYYDYTGFDDERLSGVSGLSSQIPMFARPAALANAYTAVSDDAYGVLYNPAGMPWVEHREGALAYQYRFGMDMLAVSYADKATRDIGFGQALMLVTDRDNLMTEMFFATAVGYKYNHMPIFGPISFGASLRLAGNTVNAQSLDSPHGQSFGAGLDLGLIWELSEQIRYGLHFKDLLFANRWKNRATGSVYNEWSPPTLRMGGSYNAGYNTFLVADGQIPLYADQPWVMAGGIEYTVFRILSLRLGLQREILDEEADWWKITGGGGVKFDIEPLWGKYLNLDFAYEYNTLELFPVVNVSLRVGF